MLHVVYQLIIYPLEILLEVAFSIIYSFRHDVGLSIIGVSIIVNFLLLPLYNRADRISDYERKKQKDMEPHISHIKKTFSGDEQFMMLQAYYRKKGYRPLYALRSSLPLLLQIPFFIAAYHFLTHLSILNNMSFLWIRNLSAPDGIIVIPAVGIDIVPSMIVLPGFSINLLPILMTIINIISAMIYTKESSLKEKLQLYIMAVLFLILLYNSPSGLVIYWTMNNIFSLIKNLIPKSHHIKEVKNDLGKKELWGKDILFILGSLFLVILLGLLIPSFVVVSSPLEFITIAAYRNPLQYVFSTMLTAMGLFLIWLPLFYYLTSKKARGIWSLMIWLYSGIAIANYFIFGKSYSYVTPELKYDTEPVFSSNKLFINLIVSVVTIIIMIYIYRRQNKTIRSVYYVLISGALILAGINIVQTQKQLSESAVLKNGEKPYEGFSISKNGKNVIVIMLDRGIGTYIPFIMAERPELKEKYAGFVYYPNTVSHGGNTVAGAPGLFGGYEYTPESMNKRPDETLKDKHDEALRVMPAVFSSNGYKTTVYDPPLAGYSEISDLSIYDDLPEVHAYSLKQRFVDQNALSFIEDYRKRCFFMYSICKTLPLICQSVVYSDGKYLYPDDRTYMNSGYLGNFGVLQNLVSLTNIEDSDQNTFMMMDNETPHEDSELQLPDYTLVANVNNNGIEKGYRTDDKGHSFEIDEKQHYYVNISAMLEIAKWLDYLREMNVYDNTRIIIVGDHGYGLNQFEDLILDDGSDMQLFIPILMYKDFGADLYSESFDFMTNADTPTLAMRGCIEEPVNPFTGNRINNQEKTERDQLVTFANGLRDDKNRKLFNKTDEVWYAVHDNVYDKSNWRILSENEFP